MIRPMKERADLAAVILSGIAANPEVNVFSSHSREQAIKVAARMAAELEQEIVRSFNEEASDPRKGSIACEKCGGTGIQPEATE